VLREISVDKDH